jgi:hypothetical protein
MRLGQPEVAVGLTALTWPEVQKRILKLLARGLQKDSEFERQWPSLLGTLLDT